MPRVAPSKVGKRGPLGLAVAAGLAAAYATFSLAAGMGASGCDTPASHVDGGDLMGVFDRDAAHADGGIVAIGSGKAADAGPADANVDAARDAAVDAPPEEDTKLRAPDPSGCVGVEGQPAASVRRTLGRPACRGGDVLEWRDPSGEPRYACVFSPNDADKRAPLPLVVFFHGETPGLDDPGSIAKQTSLRAAADTFDLGGGPDHRGFVLLVVQGRAVGKSGASYDVGYSGRDNLDRVTADHFVDVLDKRGLVDATRTYSAGFGRGGQMAIGYAMMRADRIAAFAVYAAPPPTIAWQCPGPPPPGTVIYRACDARTSCNDVESWIHSREAAGAETRSVRLGEDAHEEPNCAVSEKCTKKKGESTHERWPKGHEKEMLGFLSKHALTR